MFFFILFNTAKLVYSKLSSWGIFVPKIVLHASRATYLRANFLERADPINCVPSTVTPTVCIICGDFP